MASLKEIEEQGWSLNPGRYVGVGEQAADDGDFYQRFTALHDEFVTLNAEADRLEAVIEANAPSLLRGGPGQVS